MLLKFGKTITTATIFFSLTMMQSYAHDDNVIEAKQAEKFADLALHCVHKEYPNKISHSLKNDTDVAPPRKLHPAFYGCFDWHSSVHGHWLLVRLLNVAPDGDYKAEAIKALNESFTEEKITGELEYFMSRNRSSFEGPYGLAWFLQFTMELREWNSPKAKKWVQTLRPLEDHIVASVKVWLPKLAYPIRLGTHNQTAFAFGLMLDWARYVGDSELENLLVQRSKDYHLNDKNCPISYEPSGEDFLFPCLMEAGLKSVTGEHYAGGQWLASFATYLMIKRGQ